MVVDGGEALHAGAGSSSSQATLDLPSNHLVVPMPMLDNIDHVAANQLTHTSNLALYEEDGTGRHSLSTYLQQRDAAAQSQELLPERSQSDDSDSGQQSPAGRSAKRRREARPQKLGTIAGVYLPCLQNIFGIILFVRVPWIVGEAGVGLTLTYLAMAVICTTLTTISMSAIATNGLRSPGGAYYMISRTLGRDIGGAVGVLFYLSTAVAVSVYILGAVEVFIDEVAPGADLRDPKLNARVYGSAFLLAITIIELLLLNIVLCASYTVHSAQITSRKLTTASQLNKVVISIFFVVLACLVGILAGAFSANRLVGHVDGLSGFPGHLADNFWPGFSKPDKNGVIETDFGFVRMFGLMFPCVTGIMAGANKSGILRRPDVSIPRGTLSAIATSTTVYVIYILLVGAIASGELLRTRPPTVNLLSSVVAWPHPIVGRIGCLLSALGAGFQCYTGAPRILQALSKDDILPMVKGMQGRRATILVTYAVSAIAVLIGDLDVMAPSTTMCFLVTYTCLNLSTALLAFLNTPNWRPTWKYYHWTLSVLGGLLCLCFMFLLNWMASVIGLVLIVLLQKFLHYRGAKVTWGDGMLAYDLQLAQNTLLSLERRELHHPSNWRPQIIAFIPLEDNDNGSERVSSAPMVLSFLSQLKMAGGLSVVCSIMVGDLTEQLKDGKYRQENERLKGMLRDRDVSGFAEVLVCESLKAGITHAIQTAGMGILRPNTVVMGFPDRWTDPHKIAEYVAALRNVIAFEKVVLLLKNVRAFPVDDDVQRGSIDIYWIVHDGGILTILPFLLKKHTVWRRCRMRIFAVAQLTDNSVLMKQQLVDSLRHLRIDAESDVVELGDYDISEFAYERTMLLHERQQLMQRLKKNAGNGSNPSLHSLHPLSRRPSFAPMPAQDPAVKRKIEFMNTSVKLNQIMTERSFASDLIFCNLPAPTAEQTALDYVEYLNVLCADLKRVVLVKGSGMEVVSKFF
ncbi:hypothetical protein RI367_001079 [Sorochytrium milnesiophthora]